MPKRSNLFQRLIKSVYDGLGPDWTVTESELLVDARTDEEREVDIVARGPAGGPGVNHNMTLSVECIDRSRPADTPWVEQMVQKHKDLETDVLVLYSSTGFYRTARQKAEALKARPMTPEEASSDSWTTIAHRFEGARFKYVEPNFETPVIDVKLLTGKFHRLTVTETMYAVEPGKDFKIGLLGYLPIAKNHPVLRDVLLEHATRESRDFHCTINFPEGTKFYFNSNVVSTGELYGLYIGVKAEASEAPVDARSIMVNGTLHTRLNARTLPTEFDFYFREREGEPITGTLTRLTRSNTTTSKLNVRVRPRLPETENTTSHGETQELVIEDHHG